jgi:hypothetical protein
MGLIAGLLIFSAFGVWLSARHRAAVPAAVFAVLATLLTVSTPIGSWVPSVLTSVAGSVSRVGGQVASTPARQ